MIALKDCTAKYIMLIYRYGGDVRLEVIDASTEKTVFDFLLEMKHNDKKVWEKIEKSFQEVKQNIKERP